MKGSYKKTEEHKRKIGLANSISKMGTKQTEQHKKNISESLKGKNTWSKGRKLSQETIQKMKGKTHTEEYKKMMSKLMKGDKSPSWKGGKDRWWKKSVIQRDNYTCQQCKIQDFTEGFLDADHIKSKSKYPELRCDLKNGQTLCPNCHRRKTLAAQEFRRATIQQIN